MCGDENITPNINSKLLPDWNLYSNGGGERFVAEHHPFTLKKRSIWLKPFVGHTKRFAQENIDIARSLAY